VAIRDWCVNSRAVFQKRQVYTRHRRLHSLPSRTLHDNCISTTPSTTSESSSIVATSRHTTCRFLACDTALSLSGSCFSRSQLPRGCARTIPRVQAREIMPQIYHMEDRVRSCIRLGARNRSITARRLEYALASTSPQIPNTKFH
jgi:hypothetical protein